ncbi:MAG: bifunctional diguanylate cyclase/phosphodiesterase [Burkholderiaceae bacterium]
MISSAHRLGAPFTRLTLLRASILWMLLWPLVFGSLIAMLWVAVNVKVEEDRAQMEQSIRSEAHSISNGYAHFLKRSIEQMDQITMQIQFHWEQSNGTLDLADMVRRGLFTAPHFVMVAIFDSQGNPVTATKELKRIPSIADNYYFSQHKNNISSALHVGLAEQSAITGKTVIPFTRRLDRRDDSFAGIVLIAVEPRFFSSYYEGPSLGKSGILAVVGEDRMLRVSRMGDAVHTELGPTLKEIPLPSSAQESDWHGGRQWLSDRWFADGHRRFTVWRTLEAYPLYVAVALPEEERLQLLKKNWDTHYQLAFIITVSLLAIAGIAMLLSSAYFWKKQKKKSVLQTYRLATEAGSEGFYMLKPVFNEAKRIVDLEVLDCNEQGAGFHRLSRNGLLNIRLADFYARNGIDFSDLAKACMLAVRHGYYEGEVRFEEGKAMTLQWGRLKIVRSESGLAVTLQDISAGKRHQQELLRMANTDELTGLPNRNWMMKFLPKRLKQLSAEQGALSILFIDLDNFKNVNDRFGHAAGDELLREAARRLKLIVRPADHVVRLGGDEFTILIEAGGEHACTATVARRIIEEFAKPFELSYGQCSVGTSIGISVFPGDGESAEVLLQRADISMYCAKGDGKGSFRFYRPEFYESLKHKLDMTEALAQAIDADEFVLYFQPRIHAFSGQLQSMEALVRWISPTHGLVTPAHFIPLTESTGLITKLGELVIDKACAHLAAWRARGLPLYPVSINVSPVQFEHGNVKDVLESALRRHAIPPRLVEIELTESAMMGEQPHISAQLAAMREMGVSLAVDDFGTGYSSLSQLKRLDMDVLKVDRIFTAELGQSQEENVFFKAIVSMAHALGMRVVAEGVETRQQLEQLRMLECDEVQGFFISRPVPEEELIDWMKKHVLHAPPQKFALMQTRAVEALNAN